MIVDEYILNDINLTVKKGEYIALVGETGSESTLADLILGLETIQRRDLAPWQRYP